MKKKRTYTIFDLNYVPNIRISGKWLMEQGFNIGDKLEYIEGKNMIILLKIPSNEKVKQRDYTGKNEMNRITRWMGG